jgi:hypothetical protein
MTSRLPASQPEVMTAHPLFLLARQHPIARMARFSFVSL